MNDDDADKRGLGEAGVIVYQAAFRPFMMRVAALGRRLAVLTSESAKFELRPPPNAAITLRTVESSGFPSALRVL
jgi:hypothetical protein